MYASMLLSSVLYHEDGDRENSETLVISLTLVSNRAQRGLLYY